MAQAFSLFGSEVTMLVRSKRIMKNEETAASAILFKSLQEDGVSILLNTCCTHITKAEDANEMIIHYEDFEKNSHSLSATHVLVATGKKPNVENMGLEIAGVQFTPEKGVIVNDSLQTSNKNIYAVGDCCSKFMVSITLSTNFCLRSNMPLNYISLRLQTVYSCCRLYGPSSDQKCPLLWQRNF